MSKRLNIAVNAWILRNRNIDGIGFFLIETMQRIIKNHPEINFHILVDLNFTADYFNYPNAKISKIFPPYRHPVLYPSFLETTLPLYLKKNKIDLFLGMDGMISLVSSVPQLAVIYDINFYHNPKDMPFRNRIFYNTFYPKYARKASRIATISEFCKNDIVDNYHIDGSKIDNVYCGIRKIFRVQSEEEKALFKKAKNIDFPYFFFVGSMHARKNLTNLIEAFKIYKNQHPDSIEKLVLAGNILWDGDKIKNLITDEIKNDVLFIGRISDEDLIKWLGSASALMFVSTFEGFGLPIVEAFKSGVPVITSNTSAMPEVAGDAAILIDPFQPKEIADAMQKIITDDQLKSNLISKGFERTKIFSFDTTADLLFESAMKILNP